MTLTQVKMDPKLDLMLERVVDLPREQIWRAWTEPELLKQWFTPAPWKTVACEIDLRPGGAFKSVMESPEGDQNENVGCYLEVVPNEKLVWTNAVDPGFRPSGTHSYDFLEGPMTAVILLEPHPQGTLYRAIAMHRNENSCQKHAALGFHEGWGAALDQLIALMKKA